MEDGPRAAMTLLVAEWGHVPFTFWERGALGEGTRGRARAVLA